MRQDRSCEKPFTKWISWIRIQDVNNEHSPIKVPYAYAQEYIPATQYDIAKQWEHLKKIADKIHHRPDIEIGMLIGRNVPTAFQPLSIIYGGTDEPWAEEYKIGWTIIELPFKERTSWTITPIKRQRSKLLMGYKIVAL